MQQTEKYKLNLIERDDTFSPDALNENAQKAEQELTRLDGADAALEARADGLEGRVTALEVQKIFFGTVVYESSPQTVNLGFTPKAVLFMDRRLLGPRVLAVGEQYVCMDINESGIAFQIVENGFSVYGAPNQNFFYPNTSYNYIAFA